MVNCGKMMRKGEVVTYKEKFGAFYNSKEWKALRKKKWSDANGLCENCLKLGKVVLGKEVHHIVPIEKDWNKRLDYDNLILLCPDCHNAAHERISSFKKFLKEFESVD